jgi:hypothetical protein
LRIHVFPPVGGDSNTQNSVFAVSKGLRSVINYKIVNTAWNN